MKIPQETSRTASNEASITPEIPDVERLAAEHQRCSVSDFVAPLPPVAAHRAIEGASLIRLSLDDQRQFADLLLNPPEPAPALERAKGAHGRLIRGSR